jgi:hypothetical protein
MKLFKFRNFFTLAALLASSSLTQGALVISEIDLANNKIEIVNTGSSNINMAGYFFCNRFNGSPFYIALTTALIDAPNSDTSVLVLGGGEVLTFQMTAAYIPDASGEIGLYLNNSNFGSATNMVDYVAWGANATRDSVAATKGIWGNGTFVNVTGISSGHTIQLDYRSAGNQVSDYSLAPSSIGLNQVQIPEPTVGLLAGLGLFALNRRRN